MPFNLKKVAIFPPLPPLLLFIFSRNWVIFPAEFPPFWAVMSFNVLLTLVFPVLAVGSQGLVLNYLGIL